MICQIDQGINTLSEDFWRKPLQELYDDGIELFKARKIRVYIPSIHRYCSANEYDLCGGYTREREITDVQLVQGPDGSWRFEEVKIEHFRVQRIAETHDDKTHTHAILLNELLVPYRSVTLRYIFFHLKEYFENPVSQGSYCMSTSFLEVRTFREWLKWMRDHINILRDAGLTKDFRENWEKLKEWICQLAENIADGITTSLRKLNLALFQTHKMPANTMYHEYIRSG